jgi:hypothetical protein
MDVQKVKKAILFTDIKSSSILWKENRIQDVIQGLDQHDKVIRAFTKKHYGVIIKTAGDSYMIAFNKWEQAFLFCMECQYHQHHHPIYIGKHMLNIRIGFCYGEVLEKCVELQGKDMVDYFGTMVNKASRFESGVSDVGHFAFGFDKPPSKKLTFPKTNIKFNVSTEVYSNDCDEVVKRSDRLLNSRQRHSNCHCHEEGTLKGVGEVVAYKITIQFN